MDFKLSAEQTLLGDMVSRFLAERYDAEERRSRLVRGDRANPDLWSAFATDLGILGAPFPEEVGGLGGGPVETMVIMEALGGALVFEPYLECVVMAGSLLRHCDDAAARDRLGAIAEGAERVCVAALEPASRHALHRVRTRAERDGEGWRLSGEKSAVVAAPDADWIIVSARTAGRDDDPEGLSLFLVPADAAGVERLDYRQIDERGASDIRFTDTRLADDAQIGPEGGALPLLERMRDEAIAALSSEAVGVMRRMLNDTVTYARERRQFGQPLSNFQVLQHRMVDMSMQLELSVSATLLATLKLDAPAHERARAAAAAKATIANASRFIAQNAVQLHGAMGMTEELAVGHYFKRATVISEQFGASDHHAARYDRLRREEQRAVSSL